MLSIVPSLQLNKYGVYHPGWSNSETVYTDDWLYRLRVTDTHQICIYTLYYAFTRCIVYLCTVLCIYTLYYVYIHTVLCIYSLYCVFTHCIVCLHTVLCFR